ncbi:MAG: ATP-binding protein [Lachnospiraceae bacterium]|nr:ATP-binding protein [Lachnospiraceae bacterium]
MGPEELIVFERLKNDRILRGVAGLFKDMDKNAAYGYCAGLIRICDEMGFSGNLWQIYLTYLLVNDENSFSKGCELRESAGESLDEIALHDMEIFFGLFSLDIALLDEKSGISCFKYITDYHGQTKQERAYNKRIRDRISELSMLLYDASDPEGMLKELKHFYREFGVGKFGLNKAFRLRESSDTEFEIEPITRIAHVKLSDIVGYESAKKKLTDNTEAFIYGRKANNCLLFGDAGTGKSSSVKAIMNEYYDRGLRVIEIYKHQFKFLNEVIARIKNRNYRFIIYMDDLSFEDTETEYKYLKAVIEGGLEKKPDNILIYATSNRRHLVHENFGDKLDRRETDEIHESDTVQEKLSLYNRFGVTIYFGRPTPKEFKDIVLTLAGRYGVKTDEETLLLEANRWELSHGGLSGRTAQQFIDYVIGTMELR